MTTVNTFKEFFKKKSIIFLSIILLFVIVVIVFISPITKYLVEKYDEDYTGRKITIDWAFVNPFTGYIHFSNLKVYEFQSDSVFFSANGLSINVAMIKLFSKTYEISEFSLNHPRGIIIQNKKVFNFSDLIEKLAPSKVDPDTKKPPVHFNVLSVKIKDGEFHYRENVIPINYFIKKVNFESTGMKWDVDTIAAKFSFLAGIGNGDWGGDFTINLKNKDFRTSLHIHKFDLNIIQQYLNDLMNYGTFSANLDADINVIGNFNDKENINAKGMFAVNDFHFGKSVHDDYLSFDKLIIAIDEVSPKNKKYSYDSISLTHPYFKYERYDYLDNIQTMFGKNGENVSAVNADAGKFNLVIEIAEYIKVLSRNFFKSDYKIGRLAINNGHLKFSDYSLSEKFTIELDPMSISADSIDKNNNWVKVSMNSGIKPYGYFTAMLRINPKDSSDFDLNYNIQKLPISMFNPYIISYTSFPLDRGTLEINGTWNVRDGIIQSNNHLLVIDPRVTKRLKNKNAQWIPMPLIMFFVRELGNVMDYEIPITGNLNNPKFKLKDVIFDIIQNIFVKPITTPYRMEVKNIETKIEKALSVKWKSNSSEVSPNQEKFIEKMAEFLKQNPDASIAIYPQVYTLKEKEAITFFEAKKKYFLKINNRSAQSFNEIDSARIDKMSIKDSLFVHYLNKQINDTLVFTLQEKCTRLIGLAAINAKFEQLNQNREKAFIYYFEKNDLKKQIKMFEPKTIIPYNGFSFYTIEYKDEFPESLLKAYQQIDKLNNNAPRKKFKNERKENKQHYR